MRTLCPPFTVYRPTQAFLAAATQDPAHTKGGAELHHLRSGDLSLIETASVRLRTLGVLVPVGQLHAECESLLALTSAEAWFKSAAFKKQKMTHEISWHPSQNGDLFLDAHGRFVVVVDGVLRPFPRKIASAL